MKRYIDYLIRSEEHRVDEMLFLQIKDKNDLCYGLMRGDVIEEASRNLGGWRLMGCELFVTLEPCPMCTGAIINSRIERVVFGAYDKKAGSCGSVVNLFELPYNHRPLCTGGILQERCADTLTEFFKNLRRKKNLSE